MSRLSQWAASNGVSVGKRELSKKQFLHQLQLSVQQKDPTETLLKLGLCPLDRPFYLDKDSAIELTGEGCDGSIISYARTMKLASVAALDNWPNGAPDNDESADSNPPAEKRGKLSDSATATSTASTTISASTSASASTTATVDRGDDEEQSSTSSTATAEIVTKYWNDDIPLGLRVGPRHNPGRRTAALVDAIRTLLVQSCLPTSTVKIVVPKLEPSESYVPDAEEAPLGVVEFPRDSADAIGEAITDVLPVSCLSPLHFLVLFSVDLAVAS